MGFQLLKNHVYNFHMAANDRDTQQTSARCIVSGVIVLVHGCTAVEHSKVWYPTVYPKRNAV